MVSSRYKVHTPHHHPSSIIIDLNLLMYISPHMGGGGGLKRPLGPTVSWSGDKFRPTPTATSCRV